MLHLIQFEAIVRPDYSPRVTVARIANEKGKVRKLYCQRFHTVFKAKSRYCSMGYYFLIEEHEIYEVYAEHDKFYPKKTKHFLGIHDGEKFRMLTETETQQKGMAGAIA